MEEFMRKNAGNSISAFTHTERNDLFFLSAPPVHYAFSCVSKKCLTLMKLQLMKVFANQ